MTTTPKPLKQTKHTLTGNASGLSGDVSGLTGDLDGIPASARPCDIKDWVEVAALVRHAMVPSVGGSSMGRRLCK